MVLSNKLRKYLSLVSGVTSHMMCGSILFYQNFSFYRHSYIKENNHSITYNLTYFILPTSFLVFSIFLWVGSFLSTLIGPKLTLLIGDIVIIIACILLRFTFSWVGDYFIMMWYAIGVALIYLSPLNNIYVFIWKEEELRQESSAAPQISNTKIERNKVNDDSIGIEGNNDWSNEKERKPAIPRYGWLTGVILCGSTLSSIFPILVKVIINSKGDSPSLEIENETIYPREISSKIKLYMWIHWGIIVFLSVFNVSLIYEYNANEENIDTQDSDWGLDTNKDPLVNEDYQRNTKKISAVPVARKLGESMSSFWSSQELSTAHALTSLKLYAYFIMIMFATFSPMLIIFTYIILGQLNKIKVPHWEWCSISFIISTGMSRLLFGWWFDWINFKMWMYIICLFQLFFGSAYYYCVEVSWLFIIQISWIGISYGGIRTLFPVYMGKIFGIFNYPVTYSFINAATCVGGLIMAGFVFIMRDTYVKEPIYILTIVGEVHLGIEYARCLFAWRKINHSSMMNKAKK